MNVQEAQRQYQRALEAFRVCPCDDCAADLDEAKEQLEIAFLENQAEL